LINGVYLSLSSQGASIFNLAILTSGRIAPRFVKPCNTEVRKGQMTDACKYVLPQLSLCVLHMWQPVLLLSLSAGW
jgi:hypothetical protein